MFRPRNLAVTLLSLGVAAAAFASPAGAGEQVTKKQFRQQANEVCETAGVALGEVFSDAFEGVPQNQELPAAAVEVAVEGALPIFRTMLDDIEGLEGPPAYDKKVDKMLDQYRAVADEIEDDPAIAFAEDDNIWVKPDKAAKKLGLPDCEQG